MKTNSTVSAQGLNLKDQLISINRVTKVVKGGKNMSFAALVVIGDEAGHVGFGTGKAKEVPNAIKKAVEAAKNNLIRVPLIEGTLPHEMIGEYGAGKTFFLNLVRLIALGGNVWPSAPIWHRTGGYMRRVGRQGASTQKP